MQYQPKVLRTIESPRGFTVVPVHLRHDPDKDEAWEAEERAKYAHPAEAARELDFDTREVRGALAYHSFVFTQHVVSKMVIIPHLPIWLTCDFNVDPLIWGIGQAVRDKLFISDEIKLSPGSAGMAVEEFRNRHPNHPADIYVYGDATGNHRNPNNLNSCYDEMRLAFRGYPVRVHYRVPLANPPVAERLAAVNNKLKDIESGEIGLYFHERCTEHIADMEEVVKEPGGNGIYKVRDRENEYYNRTHASDGIGYCVTREWPIRRKVTQIQSRDRHRKRSSAPRRYGHLLGAI